MRWEALSTKVGDADALLPATSIPGLLRTVTTPEFAGVRFHEVRARSALNEVPASSSMPFRWTVNPYRGCLHQCVYCMSGDTLVLMADGTTRRLADVRAGDRVYGTVVRGRYRRFVTTEVLAHWSTVEQAFEVLLEDGARLVASRDHRFLTRRGWKYVTGDGSGRGRRPHLTTNDEMLGLGRFVESEKASPDYRRGYLTGMIRDDGHCGTYTYDRPGRSPAVQHRFRLALADEEGLDRSQAYLEEIGITTQRFAFSPGSATRRPVAAIRTSRGAAIAAIRTYVAWPDEPSAAWRRGFLAGIFDAEGSYSGGVLRISNANRSILDQTCAAFRSLGFDAVEEPPRPNGVRTVRLRGGVTEAVRFFHVVDPAIRRKCTIDGVAVKNRARLRVVSVRPLGFDMPMYDITTGTGDFIADGVISHNCYARGSHAWLELDTGRGFDTEIVVKTNVAEVLGVEVRRPGWRREHVALGTNTDPYQRAEGRYQLMPGIIDALSSSGTPFSVLTKGTLLRRDLPRLADAAGQVDVGLGVSLAIWDDELHATLEPGTPTPRARLDLVRAVREAGLPCGVFLAPVLPWLTDGEAHLDAALAALAAAGATGVTVLPLHLRPGAREWWFTWLRRERPDLVLRYDRLYARGAYVPKSYRTALEERVKPLLHRHGLAGRRGGEQRGVNTDREGAFPSGSMPALQDAQPRHPSGLEPLF